MNGALLTDPVVLICTGIIVIGVITLFWAVGKFKNSSTTTEFVPVDDLVAPASAPASDPVPEIDLKTPEFPTRPTRMSAPAVSGDVAERLEAMTQRLSEMQSVLMKQSAGAAVGAGAGTAGAMGQGFSPETIDKLLKIIGNVIQQVDILQKSLNLTK